MPQDEHRPINLRHLGQGRPDQIGLFLLLQKRVRCARIDHLQPKSRRAIFRFFLQRQFMTALHAAQFGDAWRAYAARTGALLPRPWRSGGGARENA